VKEHWRAVVNAMYADGVKQRLLHALDLNFHQHCAIGKLVLDSLLLVVLVSEEGLLRLDPFDCSAHWTIIFRRCSVSRQDCTMTSEVPESTGSYWRKLLH